MTLVHVHGWPRGLVHNTTKKQITSVNDSLKKIIPVRFIPQYQAKNPQEQGKLEKYFFAFINTVSLKAEQDYKVKVSEEGGTIYLRPTDAFSYLRNGEVSASCPFTQKFTRTYRHGSPELSMDLEFIIDEKKFVLANYSRLSA